MSHCRTCARLPLRLRGPDDVARFARQCVADGTAPVPSLIVIALDDELATNEFAVNADCVSQMFLSVDELVRVAARLDSDALALVEIRSDPVAAPSLIEAREFTALTDECAKCDLLILDCLVVIGHHWWSLREVSD